MEVDNLPNIASESSQFNKKVANTVKIHTFVNPMGASGEDSCMSTYSKIMDLLKKLNQEISVHVSSSRNIQLIFILKKTQFLFKTLYYLIFA